MNKIFIIFFFFISLVSNALADIINDIEVKGNLRLSKQSIIIFSGLNINQDYNSEDLNIAIKKLDKTDFFNKINFKIINDTLLIEVVENPIIEDLQIRGVKSKSFIKTLNEKMELKNRKPFKDSTYQSDLNLIKNIIKQNGYYFSKIETSLTRDNDRNTIRLFYDIDLGKKAKISEIIFLGDKKLKDRKLRNVIASETSKPWKFISNKVYLDEQRIELDKRLLTNYYKNKGYYLSKINDTFVESQKNNSFKLVFNIEAGEKFFFNDLKLELPTDFNKDHFRDITKVLNKLKGKKYSLNNIEKILDEVDKIALSKQYEFVNAKIKEKIIDKNKLDFVITMEETEKFYVEKINISGNNITLEEVLRNTLIVDEGDPYNEILFNKSISKMKSKNIFSKVKTEITDGNEANLKIIDIIVEEKPTGEISLGAGVGTNGSSVGGGIKENNFLGKGIKLDSNLMVSDTSMKGKFTYLKPNFGYGDNDLFTSIESSSTDNLTESGYKTSNLGFSFGTRFEQYENLFFSPSLITDVEKLTTTSTASTAIKKQEGNYFDVNFSYSLDYDLRDRSYQPTDGYNTSLYQSIPLVSDQNEIINGFEINKYKSLVSDMVGKISLFGRAANSISGDDVRLSKRLFIPSRKLRGFENGKIGPTDNNDYVGGNYAASLNISTTLPQILPSFQNTDFNIFFDAANVWGVDYDSSIDESNVIRSSVGVAMDVLTPIGPLNFSFAQPVTKKSSDKTETFRFNIGTTF
ncbi:outer membrane protein assembly factor BamA [Candidatus Pelagibacter sp.]|nr:outer membrane protein assembly factor BamA [Candidatus Pelagibacter sp.]